MGSLTSRSTHQTWSKMPTKNIEVVPLITKEFYEACTNLGIRDPNIAIRSIEEIKSPSWAGNCIWLQTPLATYLVAKYGFSDCFYVKKHNLCTAPSVAFDARYVPYFLYNGANIVKDIRAATSSQFRCIVTTPIERHGDHISCAEISCATLVGSPLEFLLGCNVWRLSS